MRKFLTASVAAIVMCSFGAGRLTACGDKLLVVGHFGYFRAYAAIHPASVVIYLPTSKQASRDGADLVSAMKRAGHDAQVMTDRAGLARVLGTHEVDVVIANGAFMPDIEAVAKATGCDTQLLAVLSHKSAADLAEAAARYGFAVKDPDMNTLLAKIDEAMGFRLSHVRPKKN